MAFLTAVVLFSVNTQAQDWKLDNKVDGVELHHAIITCNNAPAVLLKFVNTNDYEVEVSWKEVVTTSQVSTKTEGNGGKKKMTLGKGETFAANCNETKNRKCLVLPVDVIPSYAATIRSFEYKDVSVVRAR